MLQRNSLGFNGALMRIAALLVAAGKGERAGAGLPKQFVLLGGRSLVAHAFDSLSAHAQVTDIWVVIGEGQEDLLAQSLGARHPRAVIIGGKERQNSVRNGLEAIAATGAYDAVLIHDAARPFVPLAVIDRLIAALQSHSGAVPVIPVADTLARSDGMLGDSVDRSGMVRVQTPQAFLLDAVMTSHRDWTEAPATDDAQIVRKSGYAVTCVEGDTALEKITMPADFEQARRRLEAGMMSRTGFGYDVHRLEDGGELWLCGLHIPFDKGLAGHSDADVALHALVDALLGAIAQGDIGSHFPPSDPQWKGANSARFVEHARDLVSQCGGIIDHVDVTIICEAPKIGPHRDAMRARIADMLSIEDRRVSVKATTTERLGFTGRGEGIAAQAVATIRCP